MRRYLLIANQTLDSPPLWEWASRTLTWSAEPGHLHVVVPATRIEQRFTWTEGQARAAARQRLDLTLRQLGQLGVSVDGEVGDENPVLAGTDALRKGVYDAVVVSTLPAGLSSWLRLDVVRRLRRVLTIPVVHIEAASPALSGSSRRTGP